MKPIQCLTGVLILWGLLGVVSPEARAQAGRTSGSATSSTSGFNSLGGSSNRAGNSFGGGTNPFSATNANQSVFQNQQSAFGLQNPGQQQGGFIGGNSGQNFLGGNQRNQQNNQQQNQQFNRSNRAQFNQTNLNELNNQNQFNTSQDSRRAIRPQQKIAFEIPEQPATHVHTKLQTRMMSLGNNTTTLKGVVFDLNYDGVATLTGEVTSPSQKRLAENIVRLEPGVKKVVNDLKVRDPFAER